MMYINWRSKNLYKKHMNRITNKETFKYWLRINGFRLNQFGTGEKWNPIKVQLKKRKHGK